MELMFQRKLDFNEKINVFFQDDYDESNVNINLKEK